MSTTDSRAAFEAWMRSEGMKDDHDLRRCAAHATTITGCDYSWGDVEARWKAWKAATEAAKATGTAGETYDKESLTNKLWCDLKSDSERSAWLLLGRGYETGVIAASLQNELAMAYHRLSLLVEAARQAAPVVATIVADWPPCNPGCEYEDPYGGMHDHRSESCMCEAAKASICRQRAATNRSQP